MKQPLTILLIVAFSTAIAAAASAQEASAQEASAQEASAQEDEAAKIPRPAAEEQAASENEVAIRQAIASYIEAFNQGDAKALAAHWSEQGEFVTPAGETLQGREALEKHFGNYFAESKQARLELAGTVVRFLSPGVAVENGIARVLLPEQEPSETEYQAIHLKTAAGWKIDSVQEEAPAAPPPSNYEKLQDLAWMIGRWVDADDDSAIETKCRWTTNRNFLVRSFKVHIADRVDFEGTQVIGWDPAAQTIRSWVFDSDGGFGVGRWSGGGSRWTVQMLSVLPDGRRASATNIIEVVDLNSFTFRSVGRQAGDELLPNIDPVTVVRATEQ